MSGHVVSEAKAYLTKWASSLVEDLQPQGVYVFGSLIYKDGAQFGDKSDVDLIIVLPEITDALDRVDWLKALADRKLVLEDDLGKALRRSERAVVLSSVVAVTSIEVAADLHKDGAAGFFSSNQFLDLLSGQTIDGLPAAGSHKIGERLVGECLRFAQKSRNAFLSINALGVSRVEAFDDAQDPAPKPILRHAAMVEFLADDGDGDPGKEYDLDVGADKLTLLLHDRRKRLPELQANFSARRSGRGKRLALTSADQLTLVEMIFDAAVQVEAKKAPKPGITEKPSTFGAHSTVIFGQRFAASFPGVRGIAWFDDQNTVRERLGILLKTPLEFEDASPIWWTRGPSNLQISSYVETPDFLMIDDDEMLVSRLAAVNPGSYKYNFVYVEVSPLPPTGLYPQTPNRIAEVQSGESPFPYYWEEYGLVDGKHLVTRAEYDDGAATIDGKLQSLKGRTQLRGRRVTNYNFIIAAGGAPILTRAYDYQLEEHMNAMLRGEDHLDQIAGEITRLPTGRF